MSTAQQFYDKARQAVGGLYVWGGQGQVMTEAALRAKAKAYPGYFDGGRLEMMIARVRADPTLRGWDCSGLVCWALEQAGAVKAGFDTTAAGLYANHCAPVVPAALQLGDLLFRQSSGKIVHVGIYAPGACVEAAGGAYGVVQCKGLSGLDHIAKSYVDGRTYQLPDWTHYGRLQVFAEAAPVETAPTPRESVFAICSGASVNVRGGPGTTYGIVAVAHAGDKLTALTAVDGWRQITGFIGGKPTAGYMSDKYVREV